MALAEIVIGSTACGSDGVSSLECRPAEPILGMACPRRWRTDFLLCGFPYFSAFGFHEAAQLLFMVFRDNDRRKPWDYWLKPNAEDGRTAMVLLC